MPCQAGPTGVMWQEPTTAHDIIVALASLELFDRPARGATTPGRRLRREEERGSEEDEDDGHPHEERVVEAEDVRGARHVPRPTGLATTSASL